MMRFARVLPLLGLIACGVNLEVPDGTAITCTSDSQCPSNMVCRVASGECVTVSGNEPPGVSIAPVSRTQGLVSIGVTAKDPEGDDCTILVSADLGAGFVPITVQPTTLSAPADGATTIVSWDAAAALGGTAYKEGLKLRVRPSDAHGDGSEVTSEPFAFGNDPPSVTSVTLDDASVTGITVLRFAVADSAADPVSISHVQISLLGDFSDAADVAVTEGQGGNFPSGSLTQLATAPADGAPAPVHSLTWNSTLVAPYDRDHAKLRLWVRDEPFADESVAPGVSADFVLNNANTLPVVSFDSDPDTSVPGLVTVDYTLFDADGDACLVTVEYSTDEIIWSPAASASDVIGLANGQYSFTWQTTQLDQIIYPTVWLRFSASDGHGFSPQLETVSFPVDNNNAFNAPPSVSIGTVSPTTYERYLAVVNVPFTASDPNGDGVTVTAEFSPDGTAWSPASGSASAGVFSWQAKNDLPTALIDTDGDGVGDFTAVRGTSRVFFRLTPTDDHVPPAAGAKSAAATFAIGDDAPTATLTPIGGQATGQLAVQFQLVDSQADPSDVALEFSIDAGVSWHAALLVLGSTTTLAAALPTDTPATHVVVWDTADPVGGVGNTLQPSAKLRIRALDTPGPVSTYGTWTAITVSIVNQTAPSVVPEFIKSDGALHNGFVPITYTLIDHENDPADVLFEFSVDEGTNWSRCSEATIPTSEGLENLAASQAGVLHTFVWDSSANIALYAPSVGLRVTAAGASSGSLPATHLVQQRPVGLATGLGGSSLFAPPVAQTSGSAPYAALGDLNNDNIADLAFVSLNGQLRIALGTQSGGVWTGFGAASTTSIFADGGAVAIGDVTGDGIPDVVTATNDKFFSGGGSPDVVQIWKNNGAGVVTQLAGSPITTSTKCQDMHLLDADLDGRTDILVATPQGPALILYASGTAPNYTFSAGATVAVGATSASRSVGVGDLDLDGRSDIAFADGTVYYGAPSRTFTQGATIPGFHGSATTIADIDHDGDGDVVVADTQFGFAARSNGLRGFDATGTFSTGASPQTIRTTDLNADGLEDLLIVNAGGGVSVLMAADDGGVWTGNFVAAFTLPLAYNVQPNAMQIFDLNNDGRQDFVVADRNNGVETTLGRLTTAFTTASLHGAQTFATGMFSSESLVPTDFNLDGVADVMISGFSGVTLLTGSRDGRAATGVYGASLVLNTYRDPVPPVLGDFNGDGLGDVIAAGPLGFNSSPPAVGEVAYLNLYSGQATPASPFAAAVALPFSSTTEAVRCAYAAYIDAGSSLDVMIVSQHWQTAAATARPFFNNGAAGFTAGPTTSVGSFVNGCAPVDWNGDGTVDVAMYNGNFYTQAASGALSSFGAGVSGGNLVLTDYDFDGVVDVLVPRTTNIDVYHGGGTNGVSNGSFTLVGGGATGFSGTLRASTIADVDGDGLIDILSSTSGPRFAVSLGLGSGGSGNGTFAAPLEVSAPTSLPQFVTTMDTNGDFESDLVATDQTLALPNAMTMISSTRTSPAPAWRALSGSGVNGHLFGADTRPLEGNLFGVRPGGAFTQLPFTNAHVGFTDARGGTPMQSAIFLQQLRGALTGLPTTLKPITQAWTWSGARAFPRVVDPNGVIRTQVLERFGPRLSPSAPQRTGLNLSGATQRGVILDLPLITGRTATSGKVRVYWRKLDFARASNWPGDAMHGTGAGAGYLPLIGGQDILQPQYTWVTTATEVANLSTGTGPRFTIDATRSPVVIRVLVDGDATVQAFTLP